MEVTAEPRVFRKSCDEARARGLTVGFVPTMGALHRGHAHLLERARKDCGFEALSLFVNPLQFDSQADLKAYPRALEADLDLARGLGVDLAFTPDESAMYPDGPPRVTVDPGPLGERLEGRSRPGHFRGVLTAVAALLELAGPCRAYFGEKDAQQLALVRRMVLDLAMPVTVIPCATVREPDGLAISSRNARLSPRQRGAAPVLFEALSDAATEARRGERRVGVHRAHMARRIGADSLARLDYAAVVDEETWEDVDVVSDRPARALVAASFDGARLIDNLLLPSAGVGSVQNTGDAQGGS